VCPGPNSKVDGAEKEPCVFGFPLKSQPMDSTKPIPFVVVRCIEEVERRGFHEDGIYRIGGTKHSVDVVCSLFEERGHADQPIDLSYEADINAVTGCLKTFFRKVFEHFLFLSFYLCLFDASS